MPSIRRLFPAERIAPLDLGPPLEPLGKLISRAEFDAELAWQRDHAGKPWMLPLWAWGMFADTEEGWMQRYWPQRWMREHLFELPSLGEIPEPWLQID